MPINSQYLDEIRTNIKVRPIFWDGYVRANLLTADEAALIKSIDKQLRDKNEPSKESANQFALAIIDLLSRLTREDVIKYILSLVGDIAFSGVESFAISLTEEKAGDETIYSVLLKYFEKADEQIYLLAFRALSGVLALKKAPDSTVTTFLQYVAEKLLTSTNDNLQEVGVQCLESILEKKWYRKTVWKHSDAILSPLYNILKAPGRSNIQLQYTVLLCFWLLTFETTPCQQLSIDLVPILLDAAKSSVKEKIVRISIGTIANTVKLAPKVSIPAIISHGGVSLIKTLSERKWADEELIADLNTLVETLDDAVASMSTFDEYSSEVLGKKLTWTPPHTSETFWKENIQNFKEDDWKIVKLLSQLLTSSNVDNTTLAVISNDISHIIDEAPESTKIFEKLGAKIKIMELMSSSDSEVRFQALKATQTFISHSFK